jgi:hypothetical protein
MSKRRSKRSVSSNLGVVPPDSEAIVRAAPGRFVRWRNETGRLVRATFGDIVITDWTPGLIRSMPESLSEEAVKAGLTNIGYAQ